MTTEVNVPLLRKTVEWVEEQDALPVIEREWEQTSWILTDDELEYDLDYYRELLSDPTRYEKKVPPLAGYGTNVRRFENDQATASRMLERYEGNWCGTAYCVAGRVVAWEGGEVGYDSVDWESANPGAIAGELLGLDKTQRLRLFSVYNTAADIRRIAEEIAGERL